MVTTDLAVWESAESSEEPLDGCEPLLWHGFNLDATGTYFDTLATIHGCDSVVSVAFTLHADTLVELSDEACDEYTWNGTTYNASGAYNWVGQTVHGCDSTVTIDLTLLESTSQTLVESSCSPIEFGGDLISETGSYTESIQSIHGCDSITVLNFTLLDSPQPSIQGETATCIGGSMLLEGLMQADRLMECPNGC